MSLYNGERLHRYEWKKLPIDKNVMEKVNQLYSDEKLPLVKDKYPMFEQSTGIPILYETQEEVPYMIDEDEPDAEDVEINDNDNGKGEYEGEQGLNSMEEN